MSRSYRKFPSLSVYCGGRSGKYMRNVANRKIRRLPVDYEIPKGRGFKKITESYDIKDYSCTKLKSWVIEDWEKDEANVQQGIRSWRAKYHTTLEEALDDWKKTYLCK